MALVSSSFVTTCALLCLAPSVQAQAATQCASLRGLRIDNTTLSEALDVPAGQPVSTGGTFGPDVQVTSLPAHCVVRGEVNHHIGKDGQSYGDRFELRMPVAWQGRLLFTGGGGLDGVLAPALGLQGATPRPDSPSALSLGYAVVSTDGGHHSPNGPLDGSFGSDPGARDDYTSLSTKRVTEVARRIIAQFYGQPVKHAYFRGCSNGGREGLMAGERYPAFFDGIIAGAPAFNLTNAAIAEAWTTDQLASIAPKNPQGQPDLARSLTEPDLKLVVNAVLNKCDELDGLKDGMIFNPEACHFDPQVLACKRAGASGCLPTEKVDVVRKIFSGPHDSEGKPLYSTWPYDAGDAAEGWRVWITGAGSMPAINVMIFPPFFNGLVLAGALPPIDIFKFNFDTDPGRVNKAAAEINASSTDWTAFRAHHGKLLLYNGMSDPVFSGNDLIRYYKEIEAKNGGDGATHDFARLFLVPGMNHCSGGPGLDDFDALDAMQAWVENGIAPDAIRATGQAFPGRSRPLCAYPRIARYKGTGSTEDAANFGCQVP